MKLSDEPAWKKAAASKGMVIGGARITSSAGTSRPSGAFNADYFMKRMYSSSDIKGRVIAIYGNEGVGKTVVATKLGASNLLITDDNGILSLQNHGELDDISIAIPFEGYRRAVDILRLCEAGELINPKTETPFDNVIFDTISGMCSTEIRRSIEEKDVPTEKGKLAENIPTRPHYLLNEQNFGPLMKEIAGVKNFSVTLLSHLRTGTTDIPGASTHADLHGAAYKLLAKYCSVVAYMTPGENGAPRKLQVMPGNMVGAKTRRNFGKSILTDTEFVAQVEAWKLGKVDNNKQEVK